MRAFHDLLETWENWSTRSTLARALDRAATDHDREVLTRALADGTDVDPLDALRDVSELVAGLSDWRWQAVHAARVAGASWEQIGGATGVTGEQARKDHVAAIERQEQCGLGGTEAYRAVL